MKMSACWRSSKENMQLDLCMRHFLHKLQQLKAQDPLRCGALITETLEYRDTPLSSNFGGVWRRPYVD